MFVGIGAASKLLGISISTLRRWEQQGACKPIHRTLGGHRRYSLESLKTLLTQDGHQPQNEPRQAYAYARVSSHDQKSDLTRQEMRLSLYCQSNEMNFVLISDLGSGINYKKRGLNRLIAAICKGKVSSLILTHKDRLLRFGSQLLFKLCDYFGTKVVILESNLEKTFEQELVTDVIEIMTVFTARLHGRRSHKNKKMLAA